MSNYFNTPGNSAFRDFSPGPHSGTDTDPDAHVAPDSLDSRARTALTLGLLSLLFGVLTGIPAIWFGQKALRRIHAADGALKSVEAEEGEAPDVGELLVALHAELRQQASDGAIRASGIAADVTLTDPDSGEETDAVQLELDHVETDAVDVYVPYRSDPEGVKFGELVAAAGQAPVFTNGGH